jgi:RNA polymerase sigma factor (sigma-70 family)
MILPLQHVIKPPIPTLVIHHRVTNHSLHIFEVLAKQHEAMLLAYILSFIADHKLAEDVAQQTFLIAYRKINTLKDPAAFPAWLRGIARLEALATLRRHGREFPVEPDVMQQLDEAYRHFEDQHPAGSWEERFRLVEECYQQLPETLHTVCRLHYFEGVKALQIAETLRINLSAVLKRLERARIAIRECVRAKLADEIS